MLGASAGLAPKLNEELAGSAGLLAAEPNPDPVAAVSAGFPKAGVVVDAAAALPAPKENVEAFSAVGVVGVADAAPKLKAGLSAAGVDAAGAPKGLALGASAGLSVAGVAPKVNPVEAGLSAGVDPKVKPVEAGLSTVVVLPKSKLVAAAAGLSVESDLPKADVGVVLPAGLSVPFEVAPNAKEGVSLLAGSGVEVAGLPKLNFGADGADFASPNPPKGLGAAVSAGLLTPNCTLAMPPESQSNMTHRERRGLLGGGRGRHGILRVRLGLETFYIHSLATKDAPTAGAAFRHSQHGRRCSSCSTKAECRLGRGDFCRLLDWFWRRRRRSTDTEIRSSLLFPSRAKQIARRRSRRLGTAK